MLITSYQSTKDKDKFLFVPYGTKVEDVDLPLDTDDDYMELEYFKTFEVVQGDRIKRMGLNTDEILTQIKKRGYATQLAKLSFVERYF